MEVSALKYSGVVGLHGRGPLLRLQSDERLIGFIRRGNHSAFEILVSRYEVRLLAFCRHMLASREDAEDVLQEVFAAAFNAILADDRPINVRPWLYRIARNRSLNHLRRIQAVGVDSMDVHFSDNGASTADKVHNREEFRLLVGDIQGLPETQRTALLLREMDALSYEQIAEAMETTVPGVKSLLVRARVSLAEASEARLLSCDEVRIELGELAEGLRRRASPLVRRHLRACDRCSTFRIQLRETNKALTALLPIGPLVLLKKFALAHLGHSASAGSSATVAGSGATAAGSATAGSVAAAGSTVTAGGMVSAGLGAVATKAAAGLAAAALVTAGAVEVGHVTSHRAVSSVASVPHAVSVAVPAPTTSVAKVAPKRAVKVKKVANQGPPRKLPSKPPTLLVASVASIPSPALKAPAAPVAAPGPPAPPGQTVTQTVTTIIPTTASAPAGNGQTGDGAIVPTTTTVPSTIPSSATPSPTATTPPAGTSVGAPIGAPAGAPAATPSATTVPGPTSSAPPPPGPAPSPPPAG